MNWRERTITDLSEMIAVHPNDPIKFFKYRTASEISRFFRNAEAEHETTGASRATWTADMLRKILDEPHTDAYTPPETFCRVIAQLMDQADATGEEPERPGALRALNVTLGREGFEAFYAEDRQCYLRHVGTKKVAGISTSTHRPLSAVEKERRARLAAYLDKCSEDELIEQVLFPMFQQMHFQRIMVSGHRDRSNEFGKDMWMRYQLPTQNYLYIGLQAKKGKLDAAGTPKETNSNIAEIYHQTLMMLAHPVFDPETNKRVLPDHAFIVAGGEITKPAQQLLAQMLDASKRSQIMFMDRNDILNLYVVHNVPLPAGAVPLSPPSEEIPF